MWSATRESPIPRPDPKTPGKDLSLNFVPVTYPDYTLAVIQIKPLERQFWRVLNASADTFVGLKLLFNGKPQFLGVIALDGVPIGYEDGRPRDRVLWESHIALSPAGRAEFVVNGPAEGVPAVLATQAIVTGPITGPNAPAAVASPARLRPPTLRVGTMTTLLLARWQRLSRPQRYLSFPRRCPHLLCPCQRQVFHHWHPPSRFVSTSCIFLKNCRIQRTRTAQPFLTSRRR